MAKILVVDDEKDVRELLTMVLQKDGYEVVTAEDGVDALDCIGAMPKLPDLIVLDLMMPRLDGHTVIVKLKENPKTENIPVIVLTAYMQFKSLITVSEAHRPQCILEKPFKTKVLLEKIKEILG